MLPSSVVVIGLKVKKEFSERADNQIKLSTWVKPVPLSGLTGRHLKEVSGCAYIEDWEIASPLKSRIYVSVFNLIKTCLYERRSPYTKRSFPFKTAVATWHSSVRPKASPSSCFRRQHWRSGRPWQIPEAGRGHYAPMQSLGRKKPRAEAMAKLTG